MIRKNNSLGIFAILLTSVYTAILTTLLMNTKQRVDFLYYKNKFNS